MGGFWPFSQDSESEDEKEKEKKIITPLNHRTNPNYNNIINNDYNYNNNDENNNNSNEDIIQLFLGEKHKRPNDIENLNHSIDFQNNKKMKKIEIVPKNQIYENNNMNQISISKLLLENKNLKEENEQNRKLIDKYNKDLEHIENEIQLKVTEALNKINKEREENDKQIRNIINNSMKRYHDENEEKLNLIIKEIPEKMEKDFQKKAQELEKLYYDAYKNINKSNKEIHTGIKCQKCFTEPIIGNRYKCSVCKNYNLCEKCENENCESMEHPHIFLKLIKKEKSKENYIINNTNDNRNKFFENNKNEIITKSYNNNREENKDIYINKNNIINNTDDGNSKPKNILIKSNIFESHTNLNKKNNIDNYSYQCLTKPLSFSAYKGTKKERFNLVLKNNGELSWPKNNSFLIKDNFSSNNIIVDKIYLEPLNPNEKCNVSVFFKNTENLLPGKYNIYLNFNVNNKNYGEKILITFEILDKKEYQLNRMVAAFRNQYKIDDKTFTDESIKLALEANENNFEDAFASLFQV